MGEQSCAAAMRLSISMDTIDEAAASFNMDAISMCLFLLIHVVCCVFPYPKTCAFRHKNVHCT